MKDTDLWKIITVFILSTVGTAYGELILLKVETLVAIGLLALVYFIGSLRFVPWRTPLRKAFTIGLFAGLLLTIILWKFGPSV